MRASIVSRHLMNALAVELLVLSSGWMPAQENCTYRKDALGNMRYQCDSGGQGTLRKDALGNWNDKRTGNRYRKDSLGNYLSSDVEDVWCKDSLGNWRDREGRRCREDALGNLACD